MWITVYWDSVNPNIRIAIANMWDRCCSEGHFTLQKLRHQLRCGRLSISEGHNQLGQLPAKKRCASSILLQSCTSPGSSPTLQFKWRAHKDETKRHKDGVGIKSTMWNKNTFHSSPLIKTSTMDPVYPPHSTHCKFARAFFLFHIGISQKIKIPRLTTLRCRSYGLPRPGSCRTYRQIEGRGRTINTQPLLYRFLLSGILLNISSSK